MLRSLILIAATLVLAGCGRTAPGTVASPSPASALVVFAASDLQFALAEVSNAFAAAGHPPPTVSFGSTGTLSRQIENGAPADVFFAADEAYLVDLERKGHVLAGTRQLYAIGRIVLVERAGLPPVMTLADLARADVRRVAIANPDHAPYGRAARDAMMRVGLWPTLQPQLVLGENVSQTFQFVRTGNADAAVVALSLAIGTPGTRYSVIDAALHGPIAQSAAVLARTRQPATASDFLAFVNGPVGRPIMKKYGFTLPGEG
ncbi:MAG TPA: molybdate ABC transporter substrate-binding protein [Candidatus Limnocylindria bacterium]|nr:molybdate ABC transporter substrate-binding protein [Candidatus Limnocylindria bacterium]